METRRLKVDPDQIDYKVIAEAASLLIQGAVVAFPTETVYGLGADGLNPQAVEKIFQAKGRPADNPLILHISHLDTLERITRKIPPLAQALMDRYWPGPLTIVLPKSPLVPSQVTSGLDTVAVRMPSHPVARELIAQAGIPVAAPSANLSGRPSPTRAEHVWDDLEGRIAAIVDGGPSGIGLESTVIDLSGEVPYLLRPGGVTLNELEEVLGEVKTSPEIAGTETPKAPGMKYQHYAPQAPLWILNSQDPRETAKTLTTLAKDALAQGRQPALLVSAETAVYLDNLEGVILQVFGSRKEPVKIAQNLFALLRAVDKTPAEVIFAEGLEAEGLGVAIMNRLWKAAGGKFVGR